MFRVQENLDGTTSIFCKNSGNLLCTIPSKGNSSVPRRVNVVEPQPVNVNESNWYHLKRQRSCPMSDEPAQLKDEKADIPLTRESQCCLSPIPILPDGDQSEDYSDDCLTQENFAKCLDLVSMERLRTVPRESLLAEYPLRLLSRSKAYRTHETPLRDIKIPDLLPLTSYLGTRVLRLNATRNFVGEERISISLRSYEGFCRQPYNTANPTACHFPKLRCREKKHYPVVTASKVLRQHASHYYTYGRRQRMERQFTFMTGLDTRSRKLLCLCNAKRCTVVIVRLAEQEIQDWLSRKSAFPPSAYLESDEDSDSEPSYIPTPSSSRAIAFGAAPRRLSLRPSGPTSAGVSVRHYNRCVVYLKNVIMDIQRLNGSHYVRNTPICVPFYRDFLSSLRSNGPLLNSIYVANGIGPGLGTPDRDHAYYRQLSSKEFHQRDSPPFKFKELLNPESCKRTGGQRKLLQSRESHIVSVGSRKAHSKHKNSKVDSKAPTCTPNRLTSLHKMKPIPVIDLTEETTPPKQPIAMGKRPVLLNGATISQPELPNSGRRHILSDGRRQVLKDGTLAKCQSLPEGALGRRRVSPQETLGKRPAPTKGSRRSVPLVSERFLVSQWKFRCFGCGFQRLYINHEQSQNVEKAIREHMHSYHSVSDAESFLSRYLDSVNHCTVIEAFPGYKGSFDD